MAYLFSIAALILIFFIGFFFYAVLFRVLKSTSNLNGETPDEYLGALAVAIFYAVVVIISALFNAIEEIGLHLYNNWRIYLVIGIVAVASETQLQYGPQIFQVIDQGTTEFGVPVYRELVLPVLNFARILYRLGIPWLNTVNSIGTIIIQSFVSIAWNCVEQNWQLSVDLAINALQSFFISLSNFLISIGVDDIDLDKPVHELTTFTASLTFMWHCECKDLSFLTDWLFQTLNDPSFAQAINKLVNSYIEYIRIIVRTFLAFFRNGFDYFLCTNVTPQSAQITCLVNRQPTFDGLGERLCSFEEGVTRFFDAAIRNAIYTFLPMTFPVPRIAPFLGNLTCAATLYSTNMLNVWFHVDLIFPLPGYPPVHYLQYVDVNGTIGAARLSAQGIDIFFTDLRTVVTDDVGCFLASIANMTVNIANTVVRTVIQLTVDPNPTSFFAWLAAGNAQQVLIEYDVDNVGNCGDLLASNLNVPLGTWVNSTTRVLVSIGHMFSEIIPQIPNFVSYITSPTFKANINNILFQVDAWGIDTGNLVRQFDTNGDIACPLRNSQNPSTHNVNPIEDIELFCCMGSLTETAIRAINALFRYVLLVIIDLIDGTPASTVFSTGGDGDLNNDVVPKLKQFLDSSACLIPSLFAFLPNNGQCLNSGSTIQDQFYIWYSSVLEMALIPFEFAALIINAIITVSDGNTLDLCLLFTNMYNISFGALATVIRGLSNAINCLTGAGIFSDFGNFIFTIFGPNGDFITDICTTLNEIISVITIIINAFSDPSGFWSAIFNQIQTFILNLINTIIQPFIVLLNNLITDYNQFKNDVEATFSCIKNGVTQFFNNIGNCIASCLSGCGNCGFDFSSCVFKRDTPQQLSNLFAYKMDEVGSPCYSQIMASRNMSYGPELHRLFKLDADKCIESIYLARLIETVFLFQHNNTQQPVLDPYVFYDPSTQMNVMANLSSGLVAFANYGSNLMVQTVDYTGSPIVGQGPFISQSWVSFAGQNGISDQLSLRIGMIGDLFLQSLIANQNAVNQSSLVQSSFTVLKFIWKYTIGMWTTPSGSFFLPTATKKMANEIPKIKKAMYNVGFSFGSTKTYKKISQVATNNIDLVSEWIRNKSKTDDPNLLSNRVAIGSFYDKYNERLEFHRMNFGYGESLIGPRANVIPPYIPVCVDGICFNCTLLDEVLDKAIYLFILTLNESTQPIDSSQNFAVDGNAIPKPPAVSFALPVIDNFTTIRTDISGSGNLAINILEVITFHKIDWRYWGDYTVYFFTNSDAANINSWQFWANFFTHCDYQNMPRCQINPPGLGFWLSLGIYILVTIGLLFFFALLIPGSSSYILMGSAFLFIPVVLGVGYFISPWCLIAHWPTGLPLLPDCLGDDIFLGFKTLDRDCINWGTLTTPTCPTSAQDYERTFYDWKAEPYIFRDGTRNIFFLLEWQAPSVNEFLRTTSILLVSWIRNVPYFNQYLTFNFGPGGIDDTWTTFFWVTIYSISIPIILGTGFILTGLALGIAALLIVTVLLGLFAAAVLFGVSLFMSILVYGNTYTPYLKSQSDLKFLYASST
jgi:hypothetical protein